MRIRVGQEMGMGMGTGCLDTGPWRNALNSNDVEPFLLLLSLLPLLYDYFHS